MRCAIMHPTYLSWIGYYDLIDSVDRFIFLDDVQYSKNSWHNRNRIKTSAGELYLTIPIKKDKSEHEEKMLINTAKIDNSKPWSVKHLKTIQQEYGKTHYFKEVFPEIQSLISCPSTVLAEVNMRITESLARRIGITTPISKSSDIQGLSGKKDCLVVDICKKMKCDEYLSPKGAASYIEIQSPGGAFYSNNIRLYYHNYEHPTYPQRFGGFLPYMSIIDLLFNCGFESALEIIRSGRKQMLSSEDLRKELNFLI
jgi:hypothetical protein